MSEDMYLEEEDYDDCGSFKIIFDENTSHSSVIQQFINGLVFKGFASREEIEKHLLDLIPNQLYLNSKG